MARKGFTFNGTAVGFRVNARRLINSMNKSLRELDQINPSVVGPSGNPGFKIYNYAKDKNTGIYYYKFVDSGHGPSEPRAGKFMKFTVNDQVVYSSGPTKPTTPRRITREALSQVSEAIGDGSYIIPEMATGTFPTKLVLEKQIKVWAAVSLIICRDVAKVAIERAKDVSKTAENDRLLDLQHEHAKRGLTFDKSKYKPRIEADSEPTGENLVNSFGIVYAGESIEEGENRKNSTSV